MQYCNNQSTYLVFFSRRDSTMLFRLAYASLLILRPKGSSILDRRWQLGDGHLKEPRGVRGGMIWDVYRWFSGLRTSSQSYGRWGTRLQTARFRGQRECQDIVVNGEEPVSSGLLESGGNRGTTFVVAIWNLRLGVRRGERFWEVFTFFLSRVLCVGMELNKGKEIGERMDVSNRGQR